MHRHASPYTARAVNAYERRSEGAVRVRNTANTLSERTSCQLKCTCYALQELRGGNVLQREILTDKIPREAEHDTKESFFDRSKLSGYTQVQSSECIKGDSFLDS